MKTDYSKKVSNVLNEEGRLKKAKQILGVIKSQTNRTEDLICLDIGCSSGVITNYLSKYFKNIVGIDVDESAIRSAKSNYPKIEFKVMSGEDITFPNNKFDLIILNQVYEFTKNQKTLVSELYRVLNSSGFCIVGARNRLSLIEGQTGLPLIHFLPSEFPVKIARLVGKEYYPPKYLSLSELYKLFHRFKIQNLTIEILKNPMKYNFSSLIKFQLIVSLIPKWLLKKVEFLMPNFILICTKD